LRRLLWGALILWAGLILPAQGRPDLLPFFRSETNYWTRISPGMVTSFLDEGGFDSGNPRRSVHCSFGPLDLDEVLIRFDEDQKVTGYSLSVINRGDSGGFSIEELDRVRGECERMIGEWTGVEGREVKDERLRHAVWKRRVWSLPGAEVALVWSVSRPHRMETTGMRVEERAEFLRMDVTPSAEPAARVASPTAQKPPSRRASVPAKEVLAALPERVLRTPEGHVLIGGVPMVDQGMKGYCAVATVSRILQLYGMTVDQHELAQLANSSPLAGTNPNEMMEVLKRSGTRLGIRTENLLANDMRSREKVLQLYNREARREKKNPLKIRSAAWLFESPGLDIEVLRKVRLSQDREYKEFLDTIRTHVEAGIPLAWSLILGKVPEQGRTPQVSGWHMRLIIGFNDRTGELIFSDSWGAGHEAKRIRMEDAWTVSGGLYSIHPG
jgi:hypothetical protein